MPRKPRKLSSTGIYHIMARGIDRMAIFHDDEDREKYLEILADCLPGEMPVPRWETVLSSDLPTALEDGSLVPASRDKGDRPQVHDTLSPEPSWGTVLSEQLRDYILADIPEIHPFAERVLDGEAESLLLQYSG